MAASENGASIVAATAAPAISRMPGQDPPALSLAGIAKRFSRRWVLRGVSLQIPAGSILALTGRNGSGKTTLLRVIATLLQPTRGGGRVFGLDLLEDADDVRGSIGLLAHAPGLYPDLTAAENLRFAQRMLGLRGGDALILRALEEVRLADEADERVRFFSAGMQRRVALARLLMRRPRLLLLDEPHAAFDTEGVELVHALMQEVRDAGGGVVVATHSPARVEPMVTHRFQLRDGRLEAGVFRGADEESAGSPADSGVAAVGGYLG
jgi:heme exporter protein A